MNTFTRKLICMMTLVVFICCFSVHAVEQKIYDNASLFSDQDTTALQEKATNLANSHQMDIVILTTNDVQGKTSSEYAEDFYDQNDFGYDSEYSGLAFLINMQDREVAIATTGQAIRYFTDDRIDKLLDQAYSYLKSGDYHGAADNFISNVERDIQKGIPANQHNIEQETYPLTAEGRVQKSLANTWIYILISLGMGGILVGILVGVNRGKKTVNSETYLDKDSFHMIEQGDRYITTTMTQHRIERNNSSISGGGSSTHTGSSGTTHGGGSRGF